MPTKRRAFIINGLAIGEETKGVFVAWLTSKVRAKYLLRYGGCQAAHFVRQFEKTHLFSQFGSGTFAGAMTSLFEMVIDPFALFNEAEVLEKLGERNIFQRIVIHRDCLCITPFHGAMSRFRERLREKKKGTIGMGVGEAVKDSKEYPEFAIYARDFMNPNLLRQKIEGIRQVKIAQATQLIAELSVEELEYDAYCDLELLRNQEIVESMIEVVTSLTKLVRIIDDQAISTVLGTTSPIVCEGSHGVMLSPKFGFAPHTTQIDPTGQAVIERLKRHFQPREIIRLGVFRILMHRHGAGPLPSEGYPVPGFTPEEDNAGDEESWLGPFRVGPLDFVAMRYGIECCGGPKEFDGLMVSHMDLLENQDQWPICVAYTYNGEASDLDKFFFIEDGQITGIKVDRDTDEAAHQKHQLRLTELLWNVRPVVVNLTADNERSLAQVLLDTIKSKLGVYVVVTANGPRAEDRQIVPGWEHLFDV